MHTFTCKNGTQIHYNSDLSGDLIICPQVLGPIVVRASDVFEFCERYRRDSEADRVEILRRDHDQAILDLARRVATLERISDA